MTADNSGAELDLRERGAPRDGEPQFLDRRIFMQLVVLEAQRRDITAQIIGEAVAAQGMGVVVYEDVNHPHQFGVLSFSEDPADFTRRTRVGLNSISELKVNPAFTMLGRSYSTGYESDLAFWLIERPVATVMNEAWPWAVWYPLRRTGAFERLEPREKGAILREHGEIGKRYGAVDAAHDVRLACHGLDASDNEFLIGLIGKDLFPLSSVVQSMRGTRQTSEYMQAMGPFFVGRAVFRSRP